MAEPTIVAAAFELLVEEMETEIGRIRTSGARCMEAGDFKAAQQIIEQALEVTNMRDRARSLGQQWEELLKRKSMAFLDEDEAMSKERRDLDRLGDGLRTPESVFYGPIMHALDALGGSAAMKDVLERVEEELKPTLNDFDYDNIPSDPNRPRWVNTTQWARHALVTRGVLKADSPRGVWELAEGQDETADSPTSEGAVASVEA